LKLNRCDEFQNNMQMQNKKLRIPYGEANYDILRIEGSLYVDKTKFIEVLEDFPKYQFLIRPRRFGKSLFISMLESYYDINKESKFEVLFGDLYIGNKPTPSKNSYLTLMFSFAGIVTNLGKDALIECFTDEVLSKINYCLSAYSHILKLETLPEKSQTAIGAIRFFVSLAKKEKMPIFIFIDEYDNFANDLISMNNDDLYKELMQGEGFVRTFYKTLKESCQQSDIRLFMTGVSPIMLDDLASGFNVTTNLTIEPSLNEIMGFNEEEVNHIFEMFSIEGEVKRKIFSDLKYFYNGYLFSSEATTRLYNSDMIMYFFEKYVRSQKYPNPILDENVRTDYRKIQKLALLFQDSESVNNIIENNETEIELVTRFPLDMMYKDKNNFTSLLFYMGMLTIKAANKNKTILTIPNYVIKTIYWEYFQNYLKSEVNLDRKLIDTAMTQMQQFGNIQPFIDYIAEILGILSNRDLMKFNEKYIKVILLTIFFTDGLFLIFSERELPGGYIDILLVKDPRYAEYISYEWLIELKYIPEKKANTLEEIRKTGLEQLERYALDAESRERIAPEGFKKALLTFVGKNKIVLN